VKRERNLHPKERHNHTEGEREILEFQGSNTDRWSRIQEPKYSRIKQERLQEKEKIPNGAAKN